MGNPGRNFAHDSEGRRIRKFISAGTGAGAASTVVFAYDQDDQLLGEYDASGKAIREYVWLGNRPVAVFTPDTKAATPAAAATNPPLVYYIHTDHLNTPRVVMDRANKLRWRWMAEPFGTTAPETNPSALGSFTLPLRFPGQYADAESGLFYNHHRSYDPALGRYTQSDPIGLLGGINTYGYVGGDPLRKIDPRGLDNPGMGPYGPYWTGVLRCKRPINISWVGRASTVLPNHNWLLTGTAEAGMGARCPVPGQGCSDVPGAQTQTLDHTGQNQTSDASCEIVPEVDEQCVSDAIRPGQSTGRWMPWNQCQSFADDVLEKCSTKKQVPFSPRNGQAWR